jgi:hypothetical protein
MMCPLPDTEDNISAEAIKVVVMTLEPMKTLYERLRGQQLEAIKTCLFCGGDMLGDGVRTPLVCERVELENYKDREPDAAPLFCGDPNGPSSDELCP